MKDRQWIVKENGSGYDWFLIDKNKMEDNTMGKKSLQDALEQEDESDERMVLFCIMLLLATLNSLIMTLFPAYHVYRRILEYYPFVSRPELLAWMVPMLVSVALFGAAVFTVILILYVQFHNAITGKLGNSWKDY